MTADIWARLADALARLPDYLGGHVRVSLMALALGIALSVPLALLSIRRPAFRAIALALTSVVQTIPGLALLALFYPLLLGLAALSERTLGVSFSALGFLPAVLALALYSLLPVLRNAVTGLTGIDPAIQEAALGVGMTQRQALWMVERAGGRWTVPQIFIGDTHVGGCDDLYALDDAGGLDPLLAEHTTVQT